MKDKKEKQIMEIFDKMDVYNDAIKYFGEMTKSIGLQGKCQKVLVPGGANIMLYNLINEYNNCSHMRFSEAFRGTFKSKKSEDVSKNLQKFRKRIGQTIEKRYGCGMGFAGMSQKDLIDTMDAFFGMLK